MSSPSSSSSRLANDVRALTNALAQMSVLKTPRLSSGTHGIDKESGHSKYMYQQVANLLARDGMDTEDLTIAGAAMHHHFSLFVLHRLPPSTSSDSGSPKIESSSDRPFTQAGSKLESCTKIRFKSLNLCPCQDAAGDRLQNVFERGSHGADFAQHVCDIKHVLYGFSAHSLAQSERDEQQTKCLIFVLQRSLGKLIHRFHHPGKYFSSENASWWRLLMHWQDEPGAFPPQEFHLRPHIAVIMNALSPGTMPYSTVVRVDFNMALNCVTGLAVLLDVIDGKLEACRQPAPSFEDWERLTTTLRMLYSLVYETEIIRDIFMHSSLSEHILSQSNSFIDPAWASDSEEVHDGTFLFRLLQKVVAWQRSLLMLASTKVVRADIPIDLNLVLIPAPCADVTPIMDLVQELYPSRNLSALAPINSYLIGRGVLPDGAPTFPCHYNGYLLGILQAAEHGDHIFEDGVASDSQKMWAMKEGLWEIARSTKSCCYTCDKLASLLAINLPGSKFSTTFRPWSPPPGITDETLKALRSDLMAQLKRRLDGMFPPPQWLERPAKSPKYGQLSVLRIIETLNECCPETVV